MKKQLLALVMLCFAAGTSFSQGLTLPYYSGFDSPSEMGGWLQYRTGVISTYDWGFGAPSATAPNALHHDYNVGASSNDTLIDWFVSPPFNFTAPGQVALKVYTGGFSTPFPDNCEIWFGTDDPNPATGNFVLVANLSYMLPQYQWLDTTVNISTVTDSGYIAFRYKTIGAAWSTYGIDNVNVSIITGIPGTETSLNTLQVFPNPFNSSATVALNTGVSNSILTMYDVCGQIVKRIYIVSGSKIKIERENLKSGIYFFQVTQGEKIIASDKLVITD